MDNIKLGQIVSIKHDGFIGEVVGFYTTREGKEGVVLQQVNTRVVHVYGKKWVNVLLDSQESLGHDNIHYLHEK